MKMRINFRLVIAYFLVGALCTVGSSASAIDLGGLAGKVWEKKDAIIKSGKALRKGFTSLTNEEEYYIGRAVAAKILSDYKPAYNARHHRYINTLGQMLARFSTRPETYGGYHFQLIRSNEVNAFAAPGGFIFITTGLYKKIDNEEQLAAVLAHEIAHVTLKHGLRAIKSSRLTQAFTIIGTEAVKEYSRSEVSQLTKVFEGSINDIVNKIVVSGYSRRQEYNADGEALRIIYRAGYNAAGLSEFLSTLNAVSSKTNNAGFNKTHPPASERLRKVNTTIKRYKLTGKTNAVRSKRFQAHSM
ncbi:MAG TPA: hypothetical protein ENI80_01970 [Acidiferrobacteraceae bacterium]|nr:hypothetical protein [Acidiferrobacteraceae bacterium]